MNTFGIIVRKKCGSYDNYNELTLSLSFTQTFTSFEFPGGHMIFQIILFSLLLKSLLLYGIYECIRIKRMIKLWIVQHSSHWKKRLRLIPISEMLPRGNLFIFRRFVVLIFSSCFLLTSLDFGPIFTVFSLWFSRW